MAHGVLVHLFVDTHRRTYFSYPSYVYPKIFYTQGIASYTGFYLIARGVILLYTTSRVFLHMV